MGQQQMRDNFTRVLGLGTFGRIRRTITGHHYTTVGNCRVYRHRNGTWRIRTRDGYKKLTEQTLGTMVRTMLFN